MTDEWKARKAREKLRQFITGMFPQARNGDDDGDGPKLLRHVTREAMLEQFFIVNPEFEPTRAVLTAEFAGMFISLPEFPVVSDRWDRLVSA